MEKEPRYVVCRKINGRTYYYWQRKGSPTERLPDDPFQRRIKADALNSAADRGLLPRDTTIETVRDVIRSYEKTERYEKLAAGTKTYYNRYLRELLHAFGGVPFRQLSRRVAIDYVTDGREPGDQHKVRAVLSVLFSHAQYLGLVDTNQAKSMGLTTPLRRSEIWEQDQIDLFLETAAMHRHHASVRLFFQLCRYTAQRPGDVASMQWGQYNGETIKLKQQKTGKLVEVPCHTPLDNTSFDYLSSYNI